MRWTVAGLVFFGAVALSLSAQVVWKNRSIEVRVPKYSVLTVEVPCNILNVAHLNVVQSAFPKKLKSNSVHVSVGDSPTSVGITCEKEGHIRSYNIFLLPSPEGGTTYLRIVDPGLEKLLRATGKSDEGKGKGKGILRSAVSLLRAMLTGRSLFGYTVEEGKMEYEENGLLLKELFLYRGRLLGAVYRIKNVSLLRKEIHPSMFADRGTVLIWVQGTDNTDTVELRPGEEVYLALVKLSRNFLPEAKEDFRLPVK